MHINPLEVAQMTIEIKGETPLLMHKFADKQKQQMLDKQTMKSKEKGARDIKQEVKDCIYYTPKGDIGFPASAFKKGMVEASVYLKGLNKKLIKGSVFVVEQLATLKFKKQVVNESICKIGMKRDIAMLRYRPEFQDWSTKITVRFNKAQVSGEQILNLVKIAGFHIGVGDWRPQCSGSYGQYTLGKNQVMSKMSVSQ